MIDYQILQIVWSLTWPAVLGGMVGSIWNILSATKSKDRKSWDKESLTDAVMFRYYLPEMACLPLAFLVVIAGGLVVVMTAGVFPLLRPYVFDPSSAPMFASALVLSGFFEVQFNKLYIRLVRLAEES